jgi:hypothetical protein
VLTLDAFVATWKTAKVRRQATQGLEMNAAASLHRLPTAERQAVAGLATAAAIIGAVMASTGVDTFPDHAYVRTQRLAVEPGVTYRQWLAREFPKAGISGPDLLVPGAVVRYTIQIAARPNTIMSARIRLELAATHKTVSTHDSVLRVEKTELSGSFPLR